MSDSLPAKKKATDPVQAKINEVKRFSRRIMMAPVSEAIGAILDYPQPMALVHAFPEQDLHLLVREIGVNDALLLLQLASNRQWEYLLDVETWDRDRIDLEALSRWAHLLMAVDPKRLVKWASSEKWRLFEYLLNREIDVVMLGEDESPSDLDEDFFTVDGAFYVRLRPFAQDISLTDKDAIKAFLKNRRQFVRSFLIRLAEEDYARYQAFLLESAGLILAETEEEIYRLRNVRLAEKGFLPFDEAVRVYHYLDPANLKHRDKQLPDERDPVGHLTSHFVYSVSPETAQWADAVALFNDDLLRQMVSQEMAALVNRLAVADQLKIHSRHDLQQVMDKASGYVQIALEWLARKEGVDIGQAPRLRQYIRQYALHDLFRLGFTQVLRIKWRADKWRQKAWFRSQKLPLSFWDEKWMGVLGGLLLKKPRHFNDQPDAVYAEFGTLQEVKAVESVLDEIIRLDSFLSCLNLSVKGPRSTRLTWKNLLLTHWCRQRFNLPRKLASVDVKRFRIFYENELMRFEGSACRVRKNAKETFLDWLSLKSGWPPVKIRQTVGGSLDRLFDEVEAQMGRVRPAHLDPKYIELFIIRA